MQLATYTATPYTGYLGRRNCMRINREQANETRTVDHAIMTTMSPINAEDMPSASVLKNVEAGRCGAEVSEGELLRCTHRQEPNHISANCTWDVECIYGGNGREEGREKRKDLHCKKQRRQDGHCESHKTLE